MSEPTTEAGKRLEKMYPGVWHWEDPDWNGPLGAAIEAEARAAALAEVAEKVRGLRPIVNDWFDHGYEAGNLSADVLAEAIAAAILEGTDR
jgi:hypothetical protein